MEKNLKRTTPRARFALTNTWGLAIVWRRAHESTFRLRPRISSTAVRGPFLGWSGNNNNNKKNREVWGGKKLNRVLCITLGTQLLLLSFQASTPFLEGTTKGLFSISSSAASASHLKGERDVVEGAIVHLFSCFFARVSV